MKDRTSLKSSNLRIRPMTPDEASEYSASYDENMLDIVRKNADKCTKAYEEKKRDYFFMTLWDITLILKDRKEISIGKVFFHGVHINGSVEMSLYFHEDFRNKGFGARVIKMITDWAFNQKDIYEIHAYMDDQNSSAQKAFAKAGFVYREAERHIEHYSMTKDPTSWRGLYLILGLWVGCIIAVLFDNLYVGIPVGLFLGFSTGVLLDGNELKHREEIEGVRQKKRKTNKDK